MKGFLHLGFPDDTESPEQNWGFSIFQAWARQTSLVHEQTGGISGSVGRRVCLSHAAPRLQHESGHGQHRGTGTVCPKPRPLQKQAADGVWGRGLTSPAPLFHC